MRIVLVDDNGNQTPLPEVDQISKWLASSRATKGMSLQAVADHVGVARQAVWSWEKGKTTPIVEHLVKLMALFGEVTPNRQNKEAEDKLAEVEDILGV